MSRADDGVDGGDDDARRSTMAMMVDELAGH
jgi:hypothetical protein